jgi:hypothetical protein
MAVGSFSRWRRPLQPGPDRRRPEIKTDDSIGRPSPRYNLMPVDVHGVEAQAFHPEMNVVDETGLPIQPVLLPDSDRSICSRSCD